MPSSPPHIVLDDVALRQAFFPIQDFRGNICALQNRDGSLAQWYRYSAFGSKAMDGPFQKELGNPWRFANRREVAELSLFAHRLYNPRLMRWQTADPLGFKDGLNLYTYVHNHPFYYQDPDGQFAIPLLIPLVEFTFGLALGPLIVPTLGVIATATIAYSAYQLLSNINNKLDTDLLKETEKQSNEKRKPKYDGKELGTDTTKCPGEGFEWKGRGRPETGNGSWVKDHRLPTQESLHPDFDHPLPKKPHWDYVGPDGKARLNTDGTWEWKS